MTRATEGGAYLSGIATMLAQTDVCPACGRVHETRLFRSGASRACPVVFGAFPVVAETEPSIDDRLDEEEPEEIPVPSAGFAGPLPAARPAPRRSTLMVPWPMPSLTEDYP